MDLLRFLTAGSVDDGKSTLIGRLLYDSKSILKDQLETLEKQSKTGVLDLALLTDGLRAEREQGITIDVAYRYFSTPKRKFIIADVPGHIQYTRNMITGASNTSLIIVLIDARKGIVEQTRRHSIIASLLRIPNIVVAVNKMDLVDYSEEVFNGIKLAYQKIAERLSLTNVTYIPISAAYGDNVVERLGHMDWYKGETLLNILETADPDHRTDLKHARFPVQYVIRPQSDELHDYRGYAGKIISGVYQKGDAVTILPSGFTSTIKAIDIAGEEADMAFAPQSAVLRLQDDLDISRGDLIVKSDDLPYVGKELDVLLCWLDTKKLLRGNRYLIQHNSSVAQALVTDIKYKLDVNTLTESEVSEAGLNEIVKIKIRTANPLAYDTYENLQVNGSIIFIDETSNVTAGAGLIQHSKPAVVD